MNEHDSERIAGLLEADGMVPADDRRRRRRRRPQHLLHPRERRQQALRHLGHLKSVKAAPARPPDRRRRLPGPEGPRRHPRSGRRHVDVVFGTHNVHRAAELLDEAPRRAARSPRSSEATDPDDADAFPSALPVRREVPWAGVGHHPDRLRQHLRLLHRARRCGARRSAARSTTSSPRSRRLAADGVTEVTLLGQNVNSYGRDLDRAPARPTSFADAACAPRSAPSTASAGSATPAPTPRTSGPRPSRPWPTTPAVCEHLHLPLQSGSDRVLAAMHRGYTAERYLDRLAAARAAIDDLAVTTDIIVGFPGETDDDFARTLEVVAEAAYDSAYTFIYRPGPAPRPPSWSTSSSPADVVAERFERLRVVVERIGAGPAPGPDRPGRGGRRRGAQQARPGGHHRPHPPEQARALRGAHRRSGPAPTPTVAVTGAAPHHLRGELVGVTAAARHRTRIPVAAG